MQSTQKKVTDTQRELTVIAEKSELLAAKKVVLERLAPNVKVTGFRSGKAPLAMVEKNINPSTLQTEFLDEILNRLYVMAVDEHNLRPVDKPNVSIKKFVPFESLEFSAEVETVGEIKLPDYRKLSFSRPTATATTQEVNAVIEQLRLREAKKET